MSNQIDRGLLNKYLTEEEQYICSDSSINIIQRQYIESAHSQRFLALTYYSITEKRLMLLQFLQKKTPSIYEQEQLDILDKASKSKKKCRNCMNQAVWQTDSDYFCQSCDNCVDFGFAAGLVGGEIDA